MSGYTKLSFTLCLLEWKGERKGWIIGFSLVYYNERKIQGGKHEGKNHTFPVPSFPRFAIRPTTPLFARIAAKPNVTPFSRIFSRCSLYSPAAEVHLPSTSAVRFTLRSPKFTFRRPLYTLQRPKFTSCHPPYSPAAEVHLLQSVLLASRRTSLAISSRRCQNNSPLAIASCLLKPSSRQLSRTSKSSTVSGRIGRTRQSSTLLLPAKTLIVPPALACPIHWKMRTMPKGFLHALSYSLQFFHVSKRELCYIRASFAPFIPLFYVYGNIMSCYTTHSHSPTSFDRQPSQHKGESKLSDKQEDELYAQNIIRVILNVKNRTTEDVVRSLQLDRFCSQIQLIAPLVDSLLQKFEADWKSALGFFEWAGSHMGYKHTQYAHDKMVDILGKMRQINQMWDLVGRMHHGGLITLETIAKIMRRLAGARRWKDAITFFDELESIGFVKDTEIMNILLDTLCKEKKVEVAREAFLVLKTNIAPNAYTFNIFVHGWCSARRIDEALWTIQEMQGFGFKPSVITFSTILQAYCNQMNLGKAYDILDRMVAEGCNPNIVTYTTLMNSHAKLGQLDEAISVVDKVKSAGCKPDILFYNSLINILGRAGLLSEAFRIYKIDIEKNGLHCNTPTYNTMISLFCYHNQWQNALNVLEDMEQSLCKPDLQTYRPLFKFCFNGGVLDDRLHSLMNNIVNKSHLSFDLDTYTTLIHNLCKVGEIGWATFLFDEMIDREVPPRSRTCRMLMQEVERKHMYEYMEKINTFMKQSQSFH